MAGLRQIALSLTLLCAAAPLHAEEAEPAAIAELGGAGQWSFTGGTSFGPNLGIETTPIPDILELEADVSPFFRHGETEWDSDFLFKKPFDLSPSLEFMAGAGPEWDHTLTQGKTRDAVGGDAALDFMYWPAPERRFGWYLEPAYGVSFSHGHEQSLSLSMGLLIPIP